MSEHFSYSSCYCQRVMSLQAEGDTLEGGGSQVNLRSSRDWFPTSHMERMKLLPLNSRRLSLAWMRQLACGLGVNTKATLADLTLLIEGKVEQLDHESRNKSKSSKHQKVCICHCRMCRESFFVWNRLRRL